MQCSSKVCLGFSQDVHFAPIYSTSATTSAVLTPLKVAVTEIEDCDCEWGERYSLERSELPEYLHQGGLQVGYRPKSCARCAAMSVVGLHNESVNIWIHTLGAPPFVPRT